MCTSDRRGARRRGWRRAAGRLLMPAAACVASLAHAAAAQPVLPPQAQETRPPLTLERTIASALARHPLVEAARARAEAARATRTLVQSVPNPIATVWLENIGVQGRPASAGASREVQAYVTWPIEQLIRRPDRVRQAEAEIDVAEAAAALARRQVVSGAVRAFFELALAQALRDEAEENRDRLAQLAAYSRARVEQGVTAEGELLRIETELDQVSTAVVLAGVALTRSQAALEPYLSSDAISGGLDALRVVVPDEPGGGPAALPAVGDLLERSARARPELVAGRARVESATAAAAYERTASWRQLGLTFGGKQLDGQTSMIASVNLAVPIFNQNRGGIARATSERIAAEEELRWAERTVAADVEGAYRAAQQLTRQIERLRQSFLSRAEAIHEYTVGAYQEGGATLLQVLDATRTLADARLTFLRTLLAERESLFVLALVASADPSGALQLFHTWTGSPSASPARGAQP
ncbi:MAG: TolC family protein [Acidobacteria bacterium]|nr:TolC family protein [Acidobacteriota bacterium]